MRILLLGATGRTGRIVLEEALRRGYDVTCLVRFPQKIKTTNARMQVLKGSPQLTEDLQTALKGCDAVINVLNISRHSDFPWSSLGAPMDLLSDVASKLIPLAASHSVKRIIVCSAWGVAETKNDIPRWFAWFIDNSNIGAAYRDHERQEALLRSSGLPWTIVRPSGLRNSKRSQKIVESFDNVPRPRLTISRLSLCKISC